MFRAPFYGVVLVAYIYILLSLFGYSQPEFRMSLVPDYGDSDESTTISSNDENESSVIKTEAERTKPQFSRNKKLPTPGFIGKDVNSDLPASASVFANPFIQAEIAKDAVLEKHVKMINTKDNTRIINGKNVCWNYRKGRCRFGHNCKYAHDSDVQKTKEQLEAENQIQQTVLCQSKNTPPPPQPSESDNCPANVDNSNKNKKKRAGLTAGLIPSKKVMKTYMSHK